MSFIAGDEQKGSTIYEALAKQYGETFIGNKYLLFVLETFGIKGFANPEVFKITQKVHEEVTTKKLSMKILSRLFGLKKTGDNFLYSWMELLKQEGCTD